MRHLLKGLAVKEKLVRVRCCKLIALSINSIGALEYVPVFYLDHEYLVFLYGLIYPSIFTFRHFFCLT